MAAASRRKAIGSKHNKMKNKNEIKVGTYQHGRKHPVHGNAYSHDAAGGRTGWDRMIHKAKMEDKVLDVILRESAIATRKHSIKKQEMTHGQKSFLANYTCGILDSYASMEDDLKAHSIDENVISQMSMAFDLIFDVNQTCHKKKGS